MGITYGDHLIDSGDNDITPEQERKIDAALHALSAPSPAGLSREEKLVWILGDLMNAVENYFGAENPKRLGHINSAAIRIFDEVLSVDASPDFWTGLGADPDLQRARKLLSMDEFRRIYRHAIGSQTATEPPLTDIQRSVLDGTFGVKSATDEPF